jgi:hypothetical protein
VPRPVEVRGRTYAYLVLIADEEHMQPSARTMLFETA